MLLTEMLTASCCFQRPNLLFKLPFPFFSQSYYLPNAQLLSTCTNAGPSEPGARGQSPPSKKCFGWNLRNIFPPGFHNFQRPRTVFPFHNTIDFCIGSYFLLLHNTIFPPHQRNVGISSRCARWRLVVTQGGIKNLSHLSNVTLTFPQILRSLSSFPSQKTQRA